MKRVFVTGSSRGIGKAIARELVTLGFDVTIHGRSDSPALAEAARELAALGGGKVSSLSFDVADRELAAGLLTREIETNGPFYGVVCSAGIVADTPFPAMTSEQWDSVLTTNLGGFFNVVRPLVLPMIQTRTGGRIVAISSISALVGNRGQVNYSASKAALIGATKSLSRELAKRRITVNCVAPGPVETDMLPPEVAKEMLAAIPMQRFARADEIAAAVGFLFNERAEYITGQTLVLSGGLV